LEEAAGLTAVGDAVWRCRVDGLLRCGASVRL